MKARARQSDSLQRVELVLALEEFSGRAAAPLPPGNDQTLLPFSLERIDAYLVAPRDAQSRRAQVETKVTIFAELGDVALAMDWGCRQFAVGVTDANGDLSEPRHYPTLELACRAFHAARHTV